MGLKLQFKPVSRNPKLDRDNLSYLMIIEQVNYFPKLNRRLHHTNNLVLFKSWFFDDIRFGMASLFSFARIQVISTIKKAIKIIVISMNGVEIARFTFTVDQHYHKIHIGSLVSKVRQVLLSRKTGSRSVSLFLKTSVPHFFASCTLMWSKVILNVGFGIIFII